MKNRKNDAHGHGHSNNRGGAAAREAEQKEKEGKTAVDTPNMPKPPPEQDDFVKVDYRRNTATATAATGEALQSPEVVSEVAPEGTKKRRYVCKHKHSILYCSVFTVYSI